MKKVLFSLALLWAISASGQLKYESTTQGWRLTGTGSELQIGFDADPTYWKDFTIFRVDNGVVYITDTTKIKTIVHGLAGYRKLEANPGKDTVTALQSIKLTALNVLTYKWTFKGPSSAAYLSTPTMPTCELRQMTTLGTYEVTLTVSDGQASHSRTIKIIRQ
jgi:hypothetical protein